MWLADIAAIISRHPELDWEIAKRYAAEVGALRLLYLALQLSLNPDLRLSYRGSANKNRPAK